MRVSLTRAGFLAHVRRSGQAGGKYPQTSMGGDSTFAKVDVGHKVFQMGDLGSKVLPASDPSSVATWKVGSTPRVAWGMRFNHGGGCECLQRPAQLSDLSWC
eukprot:SAG31_NODE_22993_length_513_cov_1.966184_1_plen_102_part_00